jgi:hypothetical protein
MIRRGTTIIEVIMYVALLAVITGILLDFTISIMTRSAKVRAQINVEQNIRFAMEKISSTIRNSKDATVPSDGGGSGSTLSLTMADAGLSPTVFQVTNGVLTMKQGAGQAVPLTSSAVSVSGLNFINLVNSVAHARTSPGWIQCTDTQHDSIWYCVICVKGSGGVWSDMCWDQYPGMPKASAWISLILKLIFGQAKLGSCMQTTAPKSVIHYQLTVSAPASAVSAEWSSSMTFYATATVPRQN